jgi:hypothetical protein
VLVVADVHRPAEHDQAVVAARVGLGPRVATEIHVADAATAVAEQAIEVAERLGGDVLEDEQFAHLGRAV